MSLIGLLLLAALAPFCFLVIAAFCCIVWSVFRAIFITDLPEEMNAAAGRKATRNMAQKAKRNLGAYDE